MKITSIEITKTRNNRRQIADVSIVIDYSLKIANIKLIDNGKKIFVEFSKTQRVNSGNISPDVVPLNPKVRNYIEREIIAEYNRLEEVAKVGEVL
jgi:DNA-binding cell septation regulator SpoVG